MNVGLLSVRDEPLRQPRDEISVMKGSSLRSKGYGNSHSSAERRGTAHRILRRVLEGEPIAKGAFSAEAGNRPHMLHSTGARANPPGIE